ncbi:hypothetical protein SAMN05216389_102264 [Oceanobacillus limi]|uniref:Uncharacterized protein n=1 Tax=Oceanobacillus limi TaxID=930131 RepID=A0A1H9ZHV1_9BACI|nr:hypothetical protein SAMN05216389_102264 [Oceanobacillus limi]
MNDGLYFYWISWIIWVMVTFFMKKTSHRAYYATWILISIILSNVYITFSKYDISLTFLSVIIGGFFLVPQIPKTTYHLFCSFTLMIGYTSILIWEGQAPVWLFMPRFILIPLICIVMVCFLVKGLISRITVTLIGICAGELLYSYMLSNYYISNIVGEMVFFDSLFIILFILICLDLIQLLKRKIVLLTQNYKRTMRWQNE